MHAQLLYEPFTLPLDGLRCCWSTWDSCRPLQRDSGVTYASTSGWMMAPGRLLAGLVGVGGCIAMAGGDGLKDDTSGFCGECSGAGEEASGRRKSSRVTFDWSVSSMTMDGVDQLAFIILARFLPVLGSNEHNKNTVSITFVWNYFNTIRTD